MPVTTENDEDPISQTRRAIQELQLTQEVLCETVSRIEYLADYTLESIRPQRQTQRLSQKANEARGYIREATQSMEETNNKLEIARNSLSELFREYHESIRREGSPRENGFR